MKTVTFYTLRIWLTTIVTAPILIRLIYSCLENSLRGTSFGFLVVSYFVVVLFELIFSPLIWLAFVKIANRVLQNINSHQQLKIIFQLAVFSLVLSTFIILFTLLNLLPCFFFSSACPYIIVTSYAVCAAASIHFYKLPNT